MSRPEEPLQLDALRREIAAASSVRPQLELTAVRAAERLMRARREHGDHDERTHAAEADAARATEHLALVRAQLQDTEAAYRAALEAFLPDRIDDDFVLDASLPIVLLPVRIETRFARGSAGPELWIRVYPDEIAVDAHETELTEEERELGRAFWRSTWTDSQHALNAWRTLLVEAPAARVAWIVRQTTPVNVDTMPRTGEPEFAEVTTKAEAWTRAAESRVLPDRWVALGYRGGSITARAMSRPVIEPLVVSLAPRLDVQTAVDVSGDGLALDPGLAWTVDFDNAEAGGMAMRMTLAPEDARVGFDRLLVFGVKCSLTPEQAAVRMAELFDAHHYARGLGFLRQGTPTNNSQLGPSGFAPDEPDGRRSFITELGPPLAHRDSDGARFAHALGLSPTVFDHVDGAERDEQSGARAMADALWPATLGYFFDQLLEVDDEQQSVDALRSYFVDHVRARGHFPAFRVGRSPYGLLVASALSRWRLRGERSPLETILPDELRRLMPVWTGQVSRAPHIRATGDPDADLVKVLEMDASAREVRIRQVLGPDTSYNVFSLMGLNWTGWGAERSRVALDLATLLGRDRASSRLFQLSYGDASWPFRGGFVRDRLPDGREPLSETDPLDLNYIRWIRTTSLEDLRLERLPSVISRPNALLYLLLRHALLLQVSQAGDRLLIGADLLTASARSDRELVGLDLTDPRTGSTPSTAPPNPWQRLAQAVPAVTGRTPLSRYLLEAVGQPGTEAVSAYKESLEALEDLPTAELERLLTETLDVCSHRLDAWITSLYAQRLRELRDARPTGSHLGAYGWVENLRPGPAGRRVPVPSDRLRALKAVTPALDRVTALETQLSRGGHIHAPSMAHAATAAILRNAYISRRGENLERYAVNLSSARVRTARQLLDAVRSGQSLGAVLGYQFERGLHEAHQPLPLDRYIEPFRAAFPLVANKLIPAEPGEPIDAIAARNVVDGLALHAAWKEGRIAWGTSGLPPVFSGELAAAEAELARLDESLDALADLLTAESVFQLVRGSAVTASATLDSLARGVRPPDPEIARAMRGGSAVHHRVALVLGGDPIQPTGWSAIPAAPRARAEPYLDGWIGSLLGDPANVRCRVAYTDGIDHTVTHDREVTLAQLGMRPLDVLATVTAAEATPQTSGAIPGSALVAELDARIAWHVLGQADAAEDANLEIRYAPSDRNLRSFPEAAELLRAIAALLGPARALTPRDLLASDRAAQLDHADLMLAEASDRASRAVADLVAAIDALDSAIAALDTDPRPSSLDLAPIRDALLHAAAFGMASAIPRSRKGNRVEQLEALLQQGRSVRAELERRRTAANATADARARVLAVFGQAFRFLPRFMPVAGELDHALNTGPNPRPSALTINRWIVGAARVRPPLRRLRHLTMIARAFGSPGTEPTIAQLPHAAAPWAAEPFADDARRPPSGTVSLALFLAISPATTSPWVGLAIDDWTELIPNRNESTAIAFQYDDPGAEAPQTVLLAVPPDDSEHWSLDSLVAILTETLDLARIRTVDGDLLEPLSQILPAIFLAANPKNETVSTTLTNQLVRDAMIRRRQ